MLHKISSVSGDGVQSPTEAFPPEEDQDETEGEQDAEGP